MIWNNFWLVIDSFYLTPKITSMKGKMYIYKSKIFLTLLTSALMITTAYCQGKPEGHIIKTITGTVINNDAVGNIITIRTQGQQQMAFSVPDKAIITHQTKNIGLMDIRAADPVTIRYYVSSSKNIVVSIADNNSVHNE